MKIKSKTIVQAVKNAAAEKSSEGGATQSKDSTAAAKDTTVVAQAETK